MDNSENGSRRPKRTAKPVTLFSFSHDHRTAAARIKESRERGRVLKAVRKNRGLSPPGNTKIDEAEGRSKEQVGDKKAVEMKDGEDQVGEEEVGLEQDGELQKVDDQTGEEVEQLEQRETREDRKGQQLKKSLKRRAKTSLIVRFSWNRN